MRIWGLVFGLIWGAFSHAFAQHESTDPLPSNEWSRLTTPAFGHPESIGFYSHGCLRGSTELPADGLGYQSVRTERNRHFAHTDLIEFIHDLAKNADTLGSALLIADIAQIRGGPLPYGHASHQLGLDVDIWFWTHPEQRLRSLSADERATLPAISMLNANGLVDEKRFTDEQILKLKLAASDPKVERIFVNPSIKLYLCTTLETTELPWLHQLRPWPGHDEHFHVRIRCPLGSKNCIPQDPVPPGDGCNELIRPRGKKIIPFRPLDLGSHPIETETTPLMDRFFKDPLPDQCMQLLKE